MRSSEFYTLLLEVFRLSPAFFGLAGVVLALRLAAFASRDLRRMATHLYHPDTRRLWASLAVLAGRFGAVLRAHLSFPARQRSRLSRRIEHAVEATVSLVLVLLISVALCAVAAAYVHFFDTERYTLKIHALTLAYGLAAGVVGRLCAVNASKNWRSFRDGP